MPLYCTALPRLRPLMGSVKTTWYSLTAESRPALVIHKEKTTAATATMRVKRPTRRWCARGSISRALQPAFLGFLGSTATRAVQVFLHPGVIEFFNVRTTVVDGEVFIGQYRNEVTKS